jgi:hypothetical protein
MHSGAAMADRIIERRFDDGGMKAQIEIETSRMLRDLPDDLQAASTLPSTSDVLGLRQVSLRLARKYEMPLVTGFDNGFEFIADR